ncbi:MAG: hypothetical protein K1X75_12265 [Leptospirales bacterium]|nr:hypothetical protein [Leptospirales bacterium]
MSSHPAAAALLEAHVAFELQRLQAPGALQKEMLQELEALLDWLEQTPLQRVLPAESALRILNRISSTEDVSPLAELLLRELAAAMLQELQKRPEMLNDLLSHEAFFFVADDIMEDAAIRRVLIRSGVNSPIFALLIAELLFNGISEFLAEGGKFAAHIPGFNMLLKAGQNLVGDGPEKGLKEFIKRYINSAIRRSEEFLNKNLKPETIREAAEQLWSELSTHGVREAIDFMPPEKLAGYSRALQAAAHSFHGSELAAHLRAFLVQFVYERQGRRPAMECLAMLGLGRDRLCQRWSGELQPALEAMLADGQLEAAVRRRLAPYYQSPEFSETLSKLQAGMS